MDTKKEKILKHLLQGGEISPLEAARFPFCTNYLASIIRDLRKDGYSIHVRREFGEGYNHYYIPSARKVG